MKYNYLLYFILYSFFGVAGYSQNPISTSNDNILYVNQSVDQTAAGYTGAGDSWANAIPELADALKWARENHEADNDWLQNDSLQIYVAKGTYLPKYKLADIDYNNSPTTDRDKNFHLVNNVQLYGGFDPANGITDLNHERILPGVQGAPAGGTVLSGDLGVPDDDADNAYHVVVSVGDVGNALLDGFSIQGGNANGTSSLQVYGNNIHQSYGGGMYNYYSSPKLTNVTISGNTAAVYGGGMYNLSSSPVLTNVTLRGNTADYGGGMHNYSSSPKLTNVTISGNTANDYGGGMYNSSYSSPLLTNVTLSGNTADYGGGMRNYSSSPKLTNVSISGNTANDQGGGMYNYYYSSPLLTNVIISGNTANDQGGGMYNYSYSSPVLTNVTIVNNKTGTSGGGMLNDSSSPKVYNNIIWGNTKTDGTTVDNIFNQSSSPEFYTSLVQGSGGSTSWASALGTDGGNNIDADPLFADVTNGDFSLQSSSPAINAGKNSYYTDTDKGNGDLIADKDLVGNPRLFGSAIDMGAYEYQGVQYTPDADNILYVNQSVDQTAAGYTGAGNSWDNAIPELADALRWARENHEADNDWLQNDSLQIYVAKGTYLPKYKLADVDNNNSPTTDRDKSFLLVNNVQLYGGFDPANGITDLNHERILPGVQGAPAGGTVLSGDLGVPDDDTDNAYHVVVSVGDVGNALLDGFSIQGGNANGTSSLQVYGNSIAQNYGGGMYNISSSPKLTNVSISGNIANSAGGGMYNRNSSPKLTNVLISDNTASFNGGGMENFLSSPRLTNVTLSGNTADYGGGMYNYSSSPVLTNVTLSGNTANEWGGGMFNDYSSSPKLTNVTLSGNTANNGGGMYNYYSSPKVYNSIIWSNTKTDGTTVDNIFNQSSSPEFYTSLVQGSGGSTSWASALGTDGGNNIDADPLFTDSANGDYSLQSSSPAIDVGKNSYYTDTDKGNGDLTVDKDLVGNPRLFGSAIDMGAYEYQGVRYSPNADNILYVNQSVDQTAAGYTGSGNSWDNAIPELADALKWANDNKATNLWGASNPLKIYVAKGIYKPKYSPEDGIVDPANPTDNRDKSFLMVENVQLYGGFDPLNNLVTLDDARVMPEVLAGGVPKQSSTILSGDIGLVAEKGDNVYHVVVSSGDVGNALVDGFLIHGGNATGGQSSIRINSNYIKRWNGGGIHLYNSCPVLRNLVISQNHADKHAGAIAMEAIQNYSFLYNILICHNTAEYGAAIVFWGAEGKGNFSNLTMYDNQSISGSSLFGFFGTTFLLSNSILVDDEWSKIGVSELKNTLLVGDDDFESIVWTDGGGNIITMESPFRNEQEGDFKLKESSQAQDAGNAQVYWNLLHDAAPSTNPLLMPEAENESWGRDLAGERRFRGEAIDMGAYEYQGVQYSPNADNILYVNQSVDRNATGYTGSGDSWDNAIPELADALKWARESYEADNDWLKNDSLQIYVAKGTYLPKYKLADVDNNNTTTTDRDKSFLLVNNVQLYGGFDPANGITELSHERIIPSVGSTPGEGTVLSGDLAGDDEANIPIVQLKDHHTRKDNAYHVVVAVGHTDGAEVKLDGFTISGGNANVMSKIQVEGRIIDRNYGGGIYFHSLKPVRLTNSMVNGNSTSHYGGGFHVSSVAVNLINSTVSDNYSGLYAGGICAVGTNLSVTMINSALTGNFAVQYGGGIYTRVLSGLNEINLNSSTLAGNKGSSYIYLDGTGTNRFTTYNSVVYGNVKSTDNSQSSLRANNLIIDKSIQYSLVQGESSTADGNLDGTAVYTDLFTDVAGGDYRLTACSPAVNAGSNSHFVGLDADTKDLAGNPRVYDFANGGIIDMGAYEFQGEQVNYDNVLFEDTAVDYDGTAYTISASNLPTGVTASYEIKDATGTVLSDAVDAGNYTITATLSGCGPDKTLTATLTIKKATLTVIADDNQSKVYGEVDPVLTYTVSGFQGSDDETVLTGSLSRVSGEDVGSYPIGQGDLSADSNYDIDFISADFAITKATLTVIADDNQSKVYGDADPVLTYTVSGYQGVDDETVLTGSLSRVSGEDVGSYPIGQGDLSADSNYDIDFISADFAITKASITGISLNDATFTYDGTSKSLMIAGTLPTGTSLTYTGNDQTDAGMYTVTAAIDGGTNYEDLTLTATLTINKASITGITLNDATFTYDGTAKSLMIAGALPTGTSLTYTGNDQTDAGMYTVTAEIDGGTNYEDLTLTATLTINKATITGITLNDATFTYDGTTKSLVIAGALPTGTSVTYTGNDQTDAGSYTVTAEIDGGTNYEDLTLTATLTINKATITGITLDDATFTYDDTAKSLVIAGALPAGTSVSYTNNDQTYAGVYTVTATIVGNNNYEGLTLTAELVIEQATITGITFADATFTYDGSVKSLAITGTSPTGTSVTYTGNAQTDAGMYTVTAVIDGGNNYEDLTLTAELVIEQATITGITLDDTTFTYDGTEKSLAITGTLPAGASMSYTGNAQTDAGIYIVTAAIDGGRNYEDLTLTAELTIEQATITGITLDDATFTYDGTAKSLMIAGALPTGTSLTYTGNDQTDAGIYIVTAAIDGGRNYEDLTLTAELTIEQATITGITLADAIFTYDGTAKSLVIDGTLPTGTSVTYTGNARTDAGNYTVTVVIDGGTSYEDLTLTAELIIEQATITGITFVDATFTYDGTAKSLVIAGALPAGTSVTYTGNARTDAGSYTVTAVIDGGNNYEDLTLTAELTIEQATITGITFVDATFTYDGTAKSLVIAGALPAGTSVTYTGNARTDAGSYTVTAVIDGGNNYEDLTLTAELTIEQATITGITFADATFTYDGSVKSLAIIGTLPAGTSVSYTNNDQTDAGIYTVTAEIDGGNNYEDLTLTAELVIEQASITGITLDDATFTYDGTAKSLVIAGALPAGTSVTYTGNDQTDAGSYTVTAAIDGGSNYEDLTLTATLTIEKASITGITLDDATFTYDGTEKSLAITGTLPAGTSVSYTNNDQTDAGMYTVSVAIDGGNNYEDLTLIATLTINKASITGITLNDATFTYDGTEKSLAITGTLPAGTSVTYTGNDQTDAGSYTVTAAIDGGTNYEDLTTTAALIIDKATQTLTFEALAVLLLEEASDFQLTAYSDSSLTVSYSYTYEDDSPSATVTPEGWVSLQHSGVIVITAFQEGNENYLAAESVGRKLRIESRDASIHRLIIEGEIFETLSSVMYYTQQCDALSNEVRVEIDTEYGARVSPSHNFVIATPRAGIYRQSVEVTSENGEVVRQYEIVVNRPFAFEDIVIQKFDNTLLVNNNSATNGGYRFVGYQWYRNDKPVGNEQIYSAGSSLEHLLEETATYRVVLTTDSGEEFHVCPSYISYKHNFGLKVYPNPVDSGGELYVVFDYPSSAFKGAIAQLYAVSGQHLLTIRLEDRSSVLRLPDMLQSGTYLLLLYIEGQRETVKIVVKP